VFGSRVLRKIFGPEKDKVTGDWRRLHNEELHDFCCSPNVIWVIKSRRMVLVVHMGERRGACRVLVGKPEGIRLLGRRRHRWEDSTKMDLEFIGKAWTGLTWLRMGTSGSRLLMH
jgi:hypothetical protein